MQDYSLQSLQPGVYTNDPFHNPDETDPRQQVVYLSRNGKEFMDGPLIHKAYVIPISFETANSNFTAIGSATRNNYRVMTLPIRKYIQWKSGPCFLSWAVVLKTLREVACNGGDWEYALRKYVPMNNLRTADERKEKLGIHRYDKMQERRREKMRVSNLIVEALGDE